MITFPLLSMQILSTIVYSIIPAFILSKNGLTIELIILILVGEVMDVLWKELLGIIYEYLTTPSDSLRFSLVCTKVRKSLPEQQHWLHQWKGSIHRSLLEITKHKYEIHAIEIGADAAHMSIRSCDLSNITIVYQSSDVPWCTIIYVYTYYKCYLRTAHIISCTPYQLKQRTARHIRE